MDKNQFVLTTNQLAQAFDALSNTLLKNFRRHKEDFIEGTHYYLLEGEELKQFLSVKFADLSQSPTSDEEDSQSPTSDVSDKLSGTKKIWHLYLWTVKGAFVHAWILKSPQAQHAYEKIMDQAMRPANVALLEAHNVQLAEQNVRLIEQYTEQTRKFNEQKQRVWEGSQSPTEETKNKLLDEVHFQEILRIIRMINTAALDMKRIKAISASDFRLLIDRIERLKDIIQRQADYEAEVLTDEVVYTQQDLRQDQAILQQENQTLQRLFQEYQTMLPAGQQQQQIEGPKNEKS